MLSCNKRNVFIFAVLLAVIFGVSEIMDISVTAFAAVGSETENSNKETTEAEPEEETETSSIEEETTETPTEKESEASSIEEETTEKQTETSSAEEKTTEKQTETSSAEEETTGKTGREPGAAELSTKGTIEAPAVEENELEITEAGPTINVTVPIYDYNIIDVVVPVTYAIAFNPYGLPINTGDGTAHTDQIISRNYGIVNKSSRDMVITVTLMVEDQNGGDVITFVDSAEAAINADKDTYAVYLTAVPADRSGIRAAGADIDKDTQAAALADVTMSKAEESAVALHAGRNQMTFKLSKAVYGFENGGDIILGVTPDNGMENLLEIISLADDGTGVTAFTFDGVMNKNADWTKLSNGIKISVVYTYKTATGDETVIVGTGAMVDAE